MSWFDSFIAIDTETTGLGERARICAIGIVHFRRGVPIETWSTLCRPEGVDWEHPDVVEALGVNGLDRRMLAEAPRFWRVAPKVFERLDRCGFWLGHNVEFDLDLLRRETERHAAVFQSGMLPVRAPCPPELVIDTILLDQAIGAPGQSRSLDAVCQRWDVNRVGAHTCLGDALTTGMLVLEMHDKLPKDTETLRSLLDKARRDRQAERAARHAERNASMKIRMIGNNVLLEREASETMSPGGIIIPDNAQKKSTYAKVRAVGPGAVNKQGVFVETTVKEGDTVLLSQWTGAEMTVSGNALLIASEDEILAIIDKE